MESVMNSYFFVTKHGSNKILGLFSLRVLLSRIISKFDINCILNVLTLIGYDDIILSKIICSQLLKEPKMTRNRREVADIYAENVFKNIRPREFGLCIKKYVAVNYVSLLINYPVNYFNINPISEKNLRRAFSNLPFSLMICEYYWGRCEFWDTSQVTDMSNLFSFKYKFNKDIGNWDTSNVTNMKGMFKSAKNFNQDIGRWNTSKVEDMTEMFSGATKFNQDISEWDTSSVTDMTSMFMDAEDFNQDISGFIKDDKKKDQMFSGALSFEARGFWDFRNFSPQEKNDIYPIFEDTKISNNPTLYWLFEKLIEDMT